MDFGLVMVVAAEQRTWSRRIRSWLLQSKHELLRLYAWSVEDSLGSSLAAPLRFMHDKKQHVCMDPRSASQDCLEDPAKRGDVSAAVR
jgi:hypothetical protein